ncbi:Hypothetical protein FKW44_016077, partial [Caligus rogercresseyi]
ASKYFKATVLFGLGKRDLSARAKAINCALLGAKKLIARRLTLDSPLFHRNYGQFSICRSSQRSFGLKISLCI